ncbi:MAG: MoxR family ATPase [Dehalococcoidia bacterium]|nr:MoxR family ATPase [Dehalococcoidia bacterium]
MLRAGCIGHPYTSLSKGPAGELALQPRANPPESSGQWSYRRRDNCIIPSPSVLGAQPVTDNHHLEKAREIGNRIISNVEKVIVGKRDLVQLGVAALFSRGHVLIEGVPGVGKTMLARSISRSLGVTFGRIQCTADLLPSDITGVYIFDQGTREFNFRPGPVMAHIVLVDEINRASPKTQSALLECMEERQITIEGTTHPMPDPFLVLATRNPTEHGGTFPLPETELDRFLLRVQMDYPTPEEEISILEQQLPVHPIDAVEQVADEEDILSAQAAVREVYVDRLVKEYIVGLVNATRQHQSVYLGASPRASLGLLSLAQSRALLEDRDFVVPDDVKIVAPAVLGHRMVLTADGRTSMSEDEAILEIVDSVPVPGTVAAERFPFPRQRG